MRVLLAEDDPRLRGAVGKSLTARGVEVFSAANGEEALRLLRAYLPDALLLDMVLPRYDGFSVMQVLPTLRLEKQPRVLALSPFRDQRILQRALEMGAEQVLPKPVELNGLYEALLHGQEAAVPVGAREAAQRLLGELGILPGTKGALYALEAIAIAATDYAAIGAVRERLYAPIAARHCTRVENVERLIRHAIEAACTRGSPDALYRLFGHTLRSETGKPTNSEFIAILAENVRLGAEVGRRRR